MGLEFHTPATYRIRVKGHSDDSWSNGLDGLAIVPLAHRETLLTVSVRGQAALHGLLNKIRDLGLPLLCVEKGKRGGKGVNP